jgi:putative tryptophan/tyrosine transport system substrate-binding protein
MAIGIGRRQFITALSGTAFVWPLTVRAQQPNKIPRIGLLSPFAASDTALWDQAFLQGLRNLGWVDGKSIIVERRYAEGRSDRLPTLVAELIRLKVDVIVTSVSNDSLAAKNATKDIPIVMAAAGDPVAIGIVESLSRPGGNITGLSQMTPDLTGKRLELLREIAPNVASVAVLFNPDDPISRLSLNEIQPSARKLAVAVRALEVRNPADLDKALHDAAGARVDALAIMPNPVFVTNLKQIAEFALQNRLPSMFHLREFADEGGLLSYGVDRADLYRRAATFVDKILKGAKPADLPIEQPTKFDLAINLKTAKALGLTVPSSLLVTADEVIE